MAYKTKLRAIGKSTGIILPKELLEQKNLKAGDTLLLRETREGYELTAYDPDLDEAMKLTDLVIRRYRNTLKKLAE